MAFARVTPVGSKAISEIAYDPEHRALRVRFAGQADSYQAVGVEPDDALGLTYARSRGTFYNDVLKDKYSWTKVVSTQAVPR